MIIINTTKTTNAIKTTYEITCDICFKFVESDSNSELPEGWKFFKHGSDSENYMAVCPQCKREDLKDYDPDSWSEGQFDNRKDKTL